MSQTEKLDPQEILNISNIYSRKGITTAGIYQRSKVNAYNQKISIIKSQKELQDPLMSSLCQKADPVVSQKFTRLRTINCRNENAKKLFKINFENKLVQNLHLSENSVQDFQKFEQEYNSKQLEQLEKKKHLINQMVDNMKLRNIKLETKKGLSIFHQNTQTNLFEMEARNPWFQSNTTSQVSPKISIVNLLH